jgi:hypothetical protein
MKRKRSQGREGVSGIGCLTSRVRPVEHIRPAAPLRTVGYCRVLSGTVGHCRGGLKRRSISRTWGSDAGASPARPSVPRRQPSGPAVEDASCTIQHMSPARRPSVTRRIIGRIGPESSVPHATCNVRQAPYAMHAARNIDASGPAAAVQQTTRSTPFRRHSPPGGPCVIPRLSAHGHTADCVASCVVVLCIGACTHAGYS